MSAAAGASTATAEPAASRTLSLEAAHAALLKDPVLQFRMDVREPPKRPEWLEWVERVLDALAPLLEVVFWGGLIVAGLLLAFFLGRELLGLRLPKRRRVRTRIAPADWRPEAGRAVALLEDADRLAEAGRYDEAVHLLLFRSIDDIRRERPKLVRPASTSRDIAGSRDLPEAARDCFGRLAATVERSFFGGRRLDREAFAECRRTYEAFAFGWAGRPA